MGIKRFITIVIVAAMLATTSAFAQFSIGLSGGAAIPQGDFAAAAIVSINPPNITSSAKQGYGGTLLIRYYLSPHAAIGFNGSYISFSGQNLPFSDPKAGGYPDATGHLTTTSETVAFDYYILTKEIKPFVGIELGYIRTTAEYQDAVQEIVSIGTGFGIAPRIGIAFELAHHFDVFLDAKYMFGMNEYPYDDNLPAMGVPATTYLGVNVGLQYKFGKD